MNLKKFDELANSPRPSRSLLAQDISEWKTYLEFVKGYFDSRCITTPVVVEIGIMHNAQKAFYKELLNAEHVGIDINPNSSPDILGDSHHPRTLRKLKHWLKGRDIDLLFIDGNHSYESVQRDYEFFGPLTRHIVAFHDIHATVNSDVGVFWKELYEANGYLAISINRCNSDVSVTDNKFMDMGIGLIIKRSE